MKKDILWNLFAADRPVDSVGFPLDKRRLARISGYPGDCRSVAGRGEQTRYEARFFRRSEVLPESQTIGEEQKLILRDGSSGDRAGYADDID